MEEKVISIDEQGADTSFTQRTYNWKDIEDFMSHIHLRLQMLGKSKPKAIVFVSRGGMVPGCMLANRLDCNEVFMVKAKSYDKRVRGTLSLVLPAAEEMAIYDKEHGEGLIVIDDIADTGVTMASLVRLWPKATFICLVKKPLSYGIGPIFAPDTCPQDVWIRFPWE